LRCFGFTFWWKMLWMMGGKGGKGTNHDPVSWYEPQRFFLSSRLTVPLRFCHRDAQDALSPRQRESRARSACWHLVDVCCSGRAIHEPQRVSCRNTFIHSYRHLESAI
jgi:hypothetical protein